MGQQTEALLCDAGEVLRDLMEWCDYMGGSESGVWKRAEVVTLKIEALNLDNNTKEH